MNQRWKERKIAKSFAKITKCNKQMESLNEAYRILNDRYSKNAKKYNRLLFLLDYSKLKLISTKQVEVEYIKLLNA